MNKKKLHILLLEDHDLVSSSVESLLTKTFEDNLIFKSLTIADTALEYIKKYNIDILLLDLVLNSRQDEKLRSGDELLRELSRINNKPKVIILSKIDSLDMLDYCIEKLGADGYIFKSKSSLTEIIPAIENVQNNEAYYSRNIKKLLKYKIGLLEMDVPDRIILKSLSNGLTQKQIATELKERNIDISVSAIEKRVRKLKIRFDANTTAHLVAIVLRKGML